MMQERDEKTAAAKAMQALHADIPEMSDDELVDRAAHYNAALRRGRRLEEEGLAIISANIDLFVICQNELHNRTRHLVELGTDQMERRHK